MSTLEISRNTEAFYTSLIEYSHDIISLTDENFNLTYRSPSAERITGWSLEERMEFGELEFIHPDDTGKLEIAMKEVLSSPGKHVPVSFRTRHKAGHYIWLEGVMTNLFFNENIKGVVTNLKDVTDRIQTEENLGRIIKEASDYKYALDESSIVAITDQKGIIKYANDNFCRISKYEHQELIGQDHRIVNSGYHPKEFIRKLWLNISKGKIWRGEIRNKAKDGSIYWVDTTIVPFLDGHGRPYQYVSVRTDITKRKKAEEDIMSLNEELEKRVKERTEELESFSYSVSHDLRAPLRAVNGYARILEDDYSGLFDDEGKRLLGEVQNNAKRMGTLIDDLLSFSRLGRKDVSKSNIDMNALTESALNEINQSIVHHAEIKFTNLHPIMADYNLMMHVMTNLLSNAIKYSSKKEKPEVEIKSERQNNEVIYSITDNGVGFEHEYANKLFGVFQRLHTTKEFPGTGVGLAIVARIIKKHNGRVWGEAQFGKGATFSFSLPDSNELKSN